MRMLSSLLILTLLATPFPLPAAGPVVTLDPTAPVKIKRGMQRTVRLKINIQAGYHVQANPASSPEMIPLTVTFPASKAFRIRTVYPRGSSYKMKGGPAPLLIYDHQVELSVTLRVSPQALPGRHVLRGKVQFQVCTDTTCLSPESLPVVINVDVVK